jgi:xylose isomerase
MGFKKVDGIWRPDFMNLELGKYFSAGDWNINPGGSRFIPATRFELTLAAKCQLMKAAGVTHLEFHDTEAPPEQAEAIMKIVRDEGLDVWMCTANLFKRPDFAGGNFCHPDPRVRRAAVEYTKRYIRTGIEVFGAKVDVYWVGSNGINVPLQMRYSDLLKMAADGIQEVLEWMIGTFGPERALAFAIETKFNEPPSWSFPADVGEGITLINCLPNALRPFIGFNPETCHSQMGGKRYAMELGLASTVGKLFHVHLNGGSEAPKFDEDRAFGDVNPSIPCEVMYTLKEEGYNGMIGLDVQPLPSDTNGQQAESIARSIRNVKRGLICAERIDVEALNEARSRGDQAGIAEIFAQAVTGIL